MGVRQRSVLSPARELQSHSRAVFSARASRDREKSSTELLVSGGLRPSSPAVQFRDLVRSVWEIPSRAGEAGVASTYGLCPCS